MPAPLSIAAPLRRRVTRPAPGLIVLLTLLGALPRCSDAPPPVGPQGVLLVTVANADPLTDKLTVEARDYLARLSGHPVALWRPAARVSAARLQREAADRQAALVVALDALPAKDAATLPGADPCTLTGDTYQLVAWDAGTHANRHGSTGATVIAVHSSSKLSRAYALYEVLRRLGARFYHPEQEHIPQNAVADLRARAKTATAIARVVDGAPSTCYAPDFTERAFTYHGAHPLEVREALSDSAHDFGEAERLNLWAVKNRADGFIGAKSGVAPKERYTQRVAELTALRELYGFPQTSGITLHNEQQGASAAIDPSLPTPVKAQIEAVVTQRLSSQPVGTFRSFGIHFGKTEFTLTPDKETVQWMNWAGAKALALDPDIRVEINNHTTGGQPVPHFGDLGCPSGTNFESKADYYDLAWHTDPRFGVKVHTVMFYPLEGPAHVYDQVSFAHKLCLMQQASAAGRPLTWFPEGSWWLSFDNPIPVYLPLYIATRHRDIELVRPLLATRGTGTLRGHRMFDSGHEWGYWQQDYTVGLWHWNADVSLDAAVGELMDPLCAPSDWQQGCAAKAEAVAVLQDVMTLQQSQFIDAKDWQGLPGGRYAYFAGEDPADEIAAVTGFEFRPVRVAFTVVNGWDLDQIKHFRATDLKAFADIEAAHGQHVSRLAALRSQVPDSALPWLEETLDGVHVNQLRAAQAHRLYDAVLTFRELTLKKANATDPSQIADPKAEAELRFAAATQVLAEAEQVIRKREQAYRYPAAQTHGGGLTPETAAPNGTTYPWRVHTKTHLLTYWHNRHTQVRDLLDGKSGKGAESLDIQPAFDQPGTEATLTWPALPGLTAEVDLGDGTQATTATAAHAWPGDGAWRVTGKMTTEGRDVPLAGWVVRAKVRSESPAKGFVLTSPKSPLAQSVLGQLWPAFRWAFVFPADDDSALGALALAPDLGGEGKVWFGDVTVAPLAEAVSDTFATAPVDTTLPVPDPATGQEALRLRLAQVVFTGTRAPDGALLSASLTGGIVLQDLVKALIDLAGFDQAGALKTLAGVLGFDAAKPPETVPVAGTISFAAP